MFSPSSTRDSPVIPLWIEWSGARKGKKQKKTVPGKALNDSNRIRFHGVYNNYIRFILVSVSYFYGFRSDEFHAPPVVSSLIADTDPGTIETIASEISNSSSSYVHEQSLPCPGPDDRKNHSHRQVIVNNNTIHANDASDTECFQWITDDIIRGFFFHSAKDVVDNTTFIMKNSKLLSFNPRCMYDKAWFFE